MGTATAVQEETLSAGQRARLYGFLRRLFIREVDANFLAWLHDQQRQGLWRNIGLSFGDFGDTFTAEALLEELAVDYCQLFILPSGGGNPHESVHVDSTDGRNARPLLWGDPATAVKDLYREYGFSIREASQQMPDALSVELEFMEQLCTQEAEAVAAGDVAKICRDQLFQRRMLREHLGHWFPDYARSLITVAETEFYQAMLAIAADFVVWETECAEADQE